MTTTPDTEATPEVVEPPKKLTLRLIGDPVLTPRICAPASSLKPEMLAQLLEEMRYWVDLCKGVGIAATQLGVPVRVVLVKIGDEFQPLYDPIITDQSKSTAKAREGCLSIPNATPYVERPATITVLHKSPTGEPLTSVFMGYEARIVAHEIDHLAGTLITDRCSPLAAQMSIKKAAKFVVTQAKRALNEISTNALQLRPGVLDKRLQSAGAAGTEGADDNPSVRNDQEERHDGA
jgi:peptide deformylase